MRGQEEWSSQAALASTKVGKQAGAALNRKTCPTCAVLGDAGGKGGKCGV